MHLGEAPSLICLHRPMPDLRGLISLDNKTKRVNVLIVADGAGILGKCVKLVLTSGSLIPLHLAVIFCSLLCVALCYTPVILTLHPPHVGRSIPLVTLSLASLSSYTSISSSREAGLKRKDVKEKGNDRREGGRLDSSLITS